uniref:TctD-like protein n=1 Tax=Liagoropsis maxima TaxID=1653392 RepID=A0A1G4NWK0_9FLOR|nr:Hypothetical protein ycf29 [Liagoropsis maxima]SCW22869.1 Hypothetical protein ycf29 [Liagoropsis maxima]
MCYKILLVDDDVGLLSSISEYLVNAGFIVDCVTTVTEAILKLDNVFYHLIISDIVMPNLNGYDLIEYISKKNVSYKVPLIFLTAKGMTQDRIMGYDLGCYGYLTKPFDPAELLSMIRNILTNLKNVSDDVYINQKDLFDLVDNSKTNIVNSLTEREKHVLKFVLRGMTNKEIAINLNLTVRNVEKYVSRLLSKTGTRNRTQLSQYFYRIDLFGMKGE